MSFSMPSQLPANPAAALSTLQSLAAHSAHLRFSIAGKSHDAISFDGSEGISTPFSATLYVLAQLDSSWLGQSGVVTLTDSSGHERTLAGIVAYQRDRGLNAPICAGKSHDAISFEGTVGIAATFIGMLLS
jgi:hypothetical protein